MIVSEQNRYVANHRSGQVRKKKLKMYLHDTVPCRISGCDTCMSGFQDEPALGPLLNGNESLYIIDERILTELVDTVLELPMENIICPKTAENKLSRENPTMMNVVRNKICFFPNQYCLETHLKKSNMLKNRIYLEALRTAHWYKRHHPRMNVELLVADDIDHIEKKNTMDESNMKQYSNDIKITTIKNWTKNAINNIQLRDTLLERIESYATKEETPESTTFFNEHLTADEIKDGLSQGRFMTGRLHCDPGSKGNSATISTMGRLDQFKVQGIENVNRALNGDHVIFEELENELYEKNCDEDLNSNRYVKVTAIQRRTHRTYIGTVANVSDDDSTLTNDLQSLEIVPIDTSLPNILIHTKSAKLLHNKLIEVRISHWSRTSVLPEGHWCKIIGDANDIAAFSDGILLANNVITRDFDPQVLAELPKKDFKIPESEIKRRVDLRNKDKTVFSACSVDPPGCKDIDDVLSCELLDDGHLELGVHIADVTHFVKPDSYLDREAAARCTTVYLVNRRTDMLPELLTTDLCSLVGEKDRLVFSVMWKVEKDTGKIVDTKVHKSVIRSDAALSYEKAQGIIDDTKNQSMLAKGLRNLMKISKILKQQRMDKGALVLSSVDPAVDLDPETGEIVGLKVYKMYDTNSMIEEFMLLANIYVAKQIVKAFPNISILRRHPEPDIEAIENLNKTLQAVKFKDNLNKDENLKKRSSTNSLLRYESNKSLSESINALDDPKDKFFSTALRNQVTRCMNAAVYFCSGDFSKSEYKHYGLAAEIYTHFTSPIRRYADIMVHRLLAASIDWEPLHKSCLLQRNLTMQSRLMSVKHRDAKYASMASKEHAAVSFFHKLSTSKKLQKKYPFECKASILYITSITIVALIEVYGIEAQIEMNKNEVNYTERGFLEHRHGLWEGELKPFDNIIIKITPCIKNSRPAINFEFVKRILTA